MGLPARLFAVGAVAGALALWCFTSANTPTGDTAAKEAAKVYCLSADQRSRLADAASVLRVELSQVTTGEGAEFARVCGALTAAARIPSQPAAAPQSSVKNTFTALIPVVAGAALTWFAGFWRDERTQSRLIADALQTAARKFRNAVYVEQQIWLGPSRGKRPVDAAVLTARDELASQLRKIEILRSGWREPGRLEGRLMTERLLGEQMNVSQAGETAQQRAEKQNKELRSLSNEIDNVVSALERPWRWHRAMRKKVRPQLTEVSNPG